MHSQAGLRGEERSVERQLVRTSAGHAWPSVSQTKVPSYAEIGSTSDLAQRGALDRPGEALDDAQGVEPLSIQLVLSRARTESSSA